MIRIIYCVLLMHIWIIESSASVYYVNPSNGGSNSNLGLNGSPWATIQKAASTVEAGDTVYVQAGTYTEKITFANSGTSDALITFIGVGAVTIQEPTNTSVWSGTLNLIAKSYIRIRNFSIQNAYWFGIYVEACDHIYLENNKTFNTGASGISVWNSSNIFAAHNTVRKACYQSLSTGSQECITFSGVSNFEIHHNEVFESGGSTNGGEGIDTKEACSFGKVYNNVVHDLDRLGIYADSWDKELHDIEIYNNRVFNCSDGIVISSENGGTASAINIYNNITYNNDNFGIVVSNYDLDGPRNDIRIMNNTVYNNGFGDANTAWGGGIIVYSTNVSNISIFNNIVASNDAMQISDKSGVSSVSVDHNLIHGYKGLNWTNEVKGINGIEGNPLFVDVDGVDNIANNVDDNLNVALASPAINAGVNTDAPIFDFDDYKRPAEGVVDMGAYESNSIPLAIVKNKTTLPTEELVQLYPNPNNGDFKLKLNSPLEAIDIFDLNGNRIQQYSNVNVGIITVSIHSSGLYLIRVNSECGSQTLRIVVN
ncbi:right-handed parallel beta-helix repeat-containing protein [uncultured Cytophaga sp.]|uniref:right-handed parallel beta-helix repeat-containing protein n=1 Tax=uncultured Cytophaga sp. TaxID=160238 RepID=UPI00262C3419|nr:right-handed parallel beta-helix repeat-containing protein [uncultured Cytophaga sp.]